MAANTPIPMKDPADYIEFEEAERLLSYAENIRDKLILGLLWRCGLRVSEIGKLRRKHILDQEGVIIVQGKGGKSMRMPVETELFTWVIDYCSGLHPEEYLFSGYGGKGISRFQIWKILDKYSKLSGITVTKSNRKLHPHSLRHSLAIWMVRMGVPLPKIQQILRHSSLVRTTYYLTFSLKELAEDYLKAWERAKDDALH